MNIEDSFFSDIQKFFELAVGFSSAAFSLQMKPGLPEVWWKVAMTLDQTFAWPLGAYYAHDGVLTFLNLSFQEEKNLLLLANHPERQFYYF